MDLPRIILANDADDGRAQSQPARRRRLLRQAGIADHKIAIVQWPDECPGGNGSE